ncbi:MAG TPA: class I SAM-dependent methyltransferase [Steroidobacteraceae bacterium]
MKIRDSGMPEEQTWENFFDAVLILRRLGFSPNSGDVADFGCGYGTFSIPAAHLTQGTVHAFDIDPEMISATGARARRSSPLDPRCEHTPRTGSQHQTAPGAMRAVGT